MAEYTLRNIAASDVFLMVKILKKAGIKNFAEMIQTSAKGQEAATGLQFVDVILDRLPECENEIYNLLSALSGIPAEEIAKLDADVFIGMIYEVFQNPKFKDFIGVALRYVK